ncbi:helix-turn-helix transcriptional regulator [Alkalibacillus haloalkaliphilus]|uniref:helix-turn-helix transcriptional regulator n=1 Tax=Alkalibacillus haloalkaliphilus TaxID=94136 RepID=UPI0029368A2E|nr:helix-turn-helix transcriptional regulator [Alkalibacillus haloalkaliphilus]MDV2580855.1 helix-turn-helix transcriptional regulator [Alkalibacillus haloalkaliphilus]
MDFETIQSLVSTRIRVVRAEQGITQNEMCHILGISKKTLVEIEKGRKPANWPTIVAFVSLFKDSPTVQYTLGDRNPIECLQTYSRKTVFQEENYYDSLDEYWKPIIEHEGYSLQKHYIHNHYRVVDRSLNVYMRSTDYKETYEFLERIS